MLIFNDDSNFIQLGQYYCNFNDIIKKKINITDNKQIAINIS